MTKTGERRGRANALMLAGGVVVGSLALTGCSQMGEAGEIRLADSYPVSHPFAEHGVSRFLESMESGGLEVDYFPSGQMGNARDLANLVRDRVIDIGPASAAYLEDELPLSSVSDLPNMTRDACVASGAMMELLGEGGILYEEEYEPRGLRPLWVAIIPGYEVMTADVQVKRPEDVEGLLLRSSGGAFDVTMEALGASAVSMPAGDTYEAISRRTVDGTAMPYVSVIPYNLEEVAHYSTEGLNLGSVGIPYVISEESWNALSPDEQETVIAAGHETNESLCTGINQERDAAHSYMEGEGVNFYELTDAESAEWDQRLAEVRTTWAVSLDEAGLPGSKVLDRFEEEVASRESGG